MRLVTVLLVIAFGLALAALPLTGAALIVAGGAVVLATLIRPQVSLYLLAFAVPFGSLRSLSLGGMSVTATDVLVALLAAAWLARGVVVRRIRFVHAPLILPIVLLLLAQALSLFDALSLSLAAKELLKWAEILAVYVVASSILSGDGDTGGSAPPRLRVIIALLMLATLAEAMLGAYQFVLRDGPAWFEIGRFLRAYGTFAQPNPYAGYLNLTLPLGYALFLAAWQGAGSERRDAQAARRLALWRMALALWLAVVGAALLMSLSRGAWLGFAVAFVAISLLHSKRTAAATVGGGLLVAAVLFLSSANLLPAALTQRFTSVADYFRIFDVRGVEVTDANFAVVERMAHWQAAWGMINDRPWLGYGAGNYPAAYPHYSLAGWQEPLGHAHNVLLNVTAETGLIGLTAYLLFLSAALWTCWRAALSLVSRGRAVECDESVVAARPTPSVPAVRDAAFMRAIALGVFGVLLAKITHEMLDNLWVHSMGVQVALLLAMVYASAQSARAPR